MELPRKRPSQSPSLKQPTSQSPLNDSQVPDGYYFDDAKTLILGDATPSQDVDMIDKNENVSPGGALTGGDGAKEEADEIERKKDAQVVKNDAEDDKKGVGPEVDDQTDQVAVDTEEDLRRDPRFKKGSPLSDFSPQGQAASFNRSATPAGNRELQHLSQQLSIHLSAEEPCRTTTC